jgi:hypothetical protein
MSIFTIAANAVKHLFVKATPIESQLPPVTIISQGTSDSGKYCVLVDIDGAWVEFVCDNAPPDNAVRQQASDYRKRHPRAIKEEDYGA